jgi:hypothetical protein
MQPQPPGDNDAGETSGYRLIKLKPQRVRSSVRGWVWARNRGWQRDFRKAIDQEFSKGRPEHWLDQPSGPS